ncbi:MAG TPA: hypothetical protein VFY29_18155 [Terriglobia bacterium]|nr:hypothetical protein [Terriglobia bacterium]
MTNKEEILALISSHPEGLDDDDIAEMTGIQPRQQVQQLCNQLADSRRIRRQSVEKAGKRRKIHNFPAASAGNSHPPAPESLPETWRRRLAALVAATGRTEGDLLEESLRLLAMKVLREHDEPGRESTRRELEP